MADQKWKMPAISDQAAVRFFESLQVEFSIPAIRIYAPNFDLGEFRQEGLLFRNFDFIDWSASRIISQIHAPCDHAGFYVDFSRPTTSEVELSIRRHPQKSPDAATWLRIADRVRRFVDQWLVGNGSIPISGASDAISAQFAQLHELHTRILYDAEQARLKAEAKFASRIEELESDFNRRKAEMDDALARETERVSEVERKLIESRKALDDRNHMHVRRELRAQITDALKERLAKPTLNQQALVARRSIVALCLAGVVVSVFYAGWASLDMHSLLVDPGNNIIPLSIGAVRFLLPSGAAFALVFYLLNWWKKIHAEDVRSERDLERYRYDVDRASWVVETILESRSKEGGEVPAEWVQGATHGMFARADVRDGEHEALEALAALLGVSAKAELGPGGTKFELRRDGLRKIGKGIETN